MENSTPSRRHRLIWCALAMCGTLLLLPATRPLLQTQLKMETLTYSTEPGLEAKRAVGAQRPDDYPVQFALAIAPSNQEDAATAADVSAQAQARSRRIEALAQRFPDNPSVYANLLRSMTMEEVRLQRESSAGTIATETPPPPPSPEALARFETAAQKGAALDPDNAYFPMMQAIGLLAAHRDGEALDALQAAGRCSHWTEYYQAEVLGQNRLHEAVFGHRNTLQQVGTLSNLLFPHYAQLRGAARTAVGLAAEAEHAGDVEEGIRVRHALMRCGGLMRAQGDSFISSLVGIAIANIATTRPGGLVEPTLPTSTPQTGADKAKRRAERRDRFYAYLESVGHPEEAAWARREITTGDQAKALAVECVPQSVLSSPKLIGLGVAWIVNIALLFSVGALLALGFYAHLAKAHRNPKNLRMWRVVFTLPIVGGIGLWQWAASEGGASLCGNLQYLLNAGEMAKGFDGSGSGSLVVQAVIVGLSLLIPALFVGLIAGFSLRQRVPVATGIGRGLRGASVPMAAAVFLLYAASLAPTVSLESTLKVGIAKSIRSETLTAVADSHRVWPGDPQP